MAVIAIAVLTIEADAQGRGPGGGGPGVSMGGRGGGAAAGVARIGGGGSGVRSFGGPRVGGAGVRSFSGPRIGGAGARSLSAPRIGGAGVRSFSGPRSGGDRVGIHSPGGNRLVRQTVHPPRSAVRAAPIGAGTRFPTASTRPAPGSLARNLTRGQGVLGKRFITHPAWRTAIKPVRFHGRFHRSPWPWWYGGIVVGWVGPVFWPYADYDFFDYVFWDYVYDDFWVYAYDDVYYGIYGSYAYAEARPRAAPRRAARADIAERRPAGVCSGRDSNLADWPIGRIAETVQPSEAQRTALDALREASVKAVDLLRNACPNDLPSTPTGRLAAMESRLETMLTAVQTVRPALDGFYQSLDDEQKARFNAVAPTSEAAAGRDRRDLTRLCDARSPGLTDLPIERIARAVEPSEPQRAALDELNDASIKAADALKADCPTYRPLTPVGRVERMQQRLEATLAAVRAVKPALDKFYDMLSDEQKARFNGLRSTGAAQG